MAISNGPGRPIPPTQQTISGRSPGGAQPSGSGQPSGPYAMYSPPFRKGTHYVIGSVDQGLDIEEMPPGTDVLSMTDGVIDLIPNNGPPGDPGGFGPHYPVIRVTSGPLAGRSIYYGHVDPGPEAFGLKQGDSVKAGQPIAKIGSALAQVLGHGHIEIGFWPLSPLGNTRDTAAAPGQQIKPYIEAIFNGGQALPGTGVAGSGAPGGQSTNPTDPGSAAAFAALLALPSIEQTAESMLLTGAKSLMDAKPLLPFIEQLAQGSLRNFMSMPNGNFYGFYPDYFGGMGRTPYWNIEDIEIIDGKIELSDDALATHVYVVGSNVPNFDGAISTVNKLNTGGVITIFNAFQADFLNGIPSTNNQTTKTKDKSSKTKGKGHKSQLSKGNLDPNYPALDTQSKAIKFLQKYGARPYYEEAPMIRSPYYEAFLAYQRFCLLWSRQFLTTFAFTFMPELYPGGIVAFPSHGIQCYVDQVEHSCNYENGFITYANLSAPSALKDNDGKAIDPNREWVHAGLIRAFALSDAAPVGVIK